MSSVSAFAQPKSDFSLVCIMRTRDNIERLCLYFLASLLMSNLPLILHRKASLTLRETWNVISATFFRKVPWNLFRVWFASAMRVSYFKNSRMKPRTRKRWCRLILDLVPQPTSMRSSLTISMISYSMVPDRPSLRALRPRRLWSQGIVWTFWSTLSSQVQMSLLLTLSAERRLSRLIRSKSQRLSN